MTKAKKAFLVRVVYFVIFVLAVILLVFLIKNKWNVSAAFENMQRLLRLR